MVPVITRRSRQYTTSAYKPTSKPQLCIAPYGKAFGTKRVIRANETWKHQRDWGRLRQTPLQNVDAQYGKVDIENVQDDEKAVKLLQRRNLGMLGLHITASAKISITIACAQKRGKSRVSSGALTEETCHDGPKYPFSWRSQGMT